MAASPTAAGAASRLQSEVKPTEADWIVASPMFIGLISMLIGSTDLKDIQAAGRRLSERGVHILGDHPGCESRNGAQATTSNAE